MAAPTVTQRTLGETLTTVTRQITIATGGDTDLTATNVGDVSTFTVGGTFNRLGINKVSCALDGFSGVLNFDADTDVPAINLVGYASFDFSDFIHGIPNNAGAGVTGDVFLATNGVGTADSGSIIVEYVKYTA